MIGSSIFCVIYCQYQRQKHRPEELQLELSSWGTLFAKAPCFSGKEWNKLPQSLYLAL